MIDGDAKGAVQQVSLDSPSFYPDKSSITTPTDQNEVWPVQVRKHSAGMRPSYCSATSAGMPGLSLPPVGSRASLTA